MGSAWDRPSPERTGLGRPSRCDRRTCDHGAMSDLELLDCGGGRRLERFGDIVVDRPAPPADWIPRLPPADWKRAGLRWASGEWSRGGGLKPWAVKVAGLTLEVRPAAGGQLGVFPEHAGTWTWLDRVVRAAATGLERPPEVLSLFGYTGGATLACTRAGARVAHVDSSRPAVAWARRNAELSGLSEAPIRWLVEDARAFVRRERRRGRRYDGVVLDPPSYGHGAGTWQIEDHLAPLLADLAALVGPRPSFVMLSAHTQGYDGERLGALIREHFGVAATGEPMMLVSRAGSSLPLGAWAHSPVR
jgi:23S rRNA (cytosine1962-C5)-methyltransferase